MEKAKKAATKMFKTGKKKQKLPDYIAVCKEEWGKDNTERFDLRDYSNVEWKKSNVE